MSKCLNTQPFQNTRYLLWFCIDRFVIPLLRIKTIFFQHSKVGTEVKIIVRNKPITATVAKMPFVQTSYFSAWSSWIHLNSWKSLNDDYQGSEQFLESMKRATEKTRVFHLSYRIIYFHQLLLWPNFQHVKIKTIDERCVKFFIRYISVQNSKIQ